MSSYAINQTFKDVPWGTPMPIAARLGGNMTMLRMRGLCTLVVTDAALLEQNQADPGAIPALVRSTLVNKVTDLIGAHSSSTGSVQELAAKKTELSAALLAEADPAFKQVGLSVQALEIQAIEQM